MKICICLSGQIRDNCEVSFTALQNLIADLETKGVETTLVFSIWNEISRKLEGIINIKQLSKIFVNDVIHLIPPAWYGKKLWDNLPITYDYIMQNESQDAKQWVQKYFPDAIIDCEDGKILDLFIYNSPTNDINSKKMLYKVWRANEIKKKIERDNDEKFDMVVRVRPDYTIQNLNLEADKNFVYIPHARENHTALEDTCAIGTSEQIDYYCELFPKSISSTYRWRGIHYMLSSHFHEEDFPQFNAKSAQENGFVLKHMTQNTEKMDLEDLAQDLSSTLYVNLFEVIKLKREKTQDAINKAIEIMESSQSLCETEDELIMYNILLHDVFIENDDFPSALKALLMADLNFISIDPKRFGWDHRMNFIFDLLMEALLQINMKYESNMIEELENIVTNSFVDDIFKQLDKTNISHNIQAFMTIEKGLEKLKQKNLI